MRPYTPADYLAIKTATRVSCEESGSLQSIAANTRVGAPLLSRYGSSSHPEFAPLDVAMDIDAISGGDRILRAWADLRGYRLERDDAGTFAAPITYHIGAVGKDSGELIADMCAALSNGNVSPVEAERIELDSQRVIDAARSLQADCRRIRTK